MSKYFRFLLLVAIFFLFSFNVQAVMQLDKEKGSDLNYRIEFVVNGTNNDDLNDNNINEDPTDNINDNNNVNDPTNNNNNNLDNNNNLNNNNNGTNNGVELDDTDDTDDTTFSQSNFLTTLSSGIIGGLIGSAIIYLLVVRNR